MNQKQLKIFISIGFIITGIFLYSFFRVTYGSLNATVSQTEEEKVVLKMMLRLDKLNSFLTDIESTERPLIIANDKGNLARKFHIAEIGLKNEVNALRELANEKKLKETDIPKLIDAVEKSIAFSESVIDLSQQKKIKEAIELIIAHEDETTQPLKTEYSRVSDSGRKLLKLYEDEHNANAVQTKKLLFLLGLMLFVALACTCYIIIQNSDFNYKIAKENKYLANSFNRTARAVIITDNNFEIRFYNLASEIMFRRTAKKVVGKSIEVGIGLDTTFNIDKIALKENEKWTGQIECIRPNGEKISLYNSISAIKDYGNNVIAYSFDFIDYADFKKSIDIENYLAKIFEFGNDAIIATDTNHHIKAWNKVAERMFGYTFAEVYNKPVSEFVIANDVDREKWRNVSVMTGYWQGEVEIKNREGKIYKTIFSNSSIRDDNGIITDHIGSFKDVTEISSLREDLKELNLSLAQQVEEKSALVNEVFSRINDGFAAFDNDLHITYVNSYIAAAFNKTPSELIGRNAEEVIGDIFSLRLVKEAVKTQQVIQKDFYSGFLKKWYHVSIYPSANGVTLYSQDISERKQIEKELELSRLQYENIFNNASDIIGIVDKNGKVLKVNASMERIFGYSTTEAENMFLDDFLYPKDREKNPFVLSGVPASGFQYSVGKYRKKDGTPLFAELHTSQLPDENYMGIVRDISERMAKERELLLKENAMSKSISGMGITDMTGKVTYVNEAIVKMWGAQSANELIGKHLADFFEGERVHKTLEALQTKGFDQGENIGKRMDGSLFDVQFAANLIFDAKGKPLCTFGSFLDISELKANQKAIKSERDFLYKLIDNLPCIFYMYDNRGKFYKWNNNFEIISGYSSDEILQMDPSDFYDVNERVAVKTRIENVFRGVAPNAAEFKLLTKSGNKVPIMINSWLMEYNGETLLVGIGLDLTAIKQKEEQLKALGAMVEESAAIIGSIDLQGNMLYANRILKAKMGFEPDVDITAYNINDFRTEKGKQTIKEVYASLNTTGAWSGENYYRSKDGKEYTLLQVMLLHRDNEGKPQTISTTALDITELKSKEAELNKLASIVEYTKALVLVLDRNLNFLYINQAAKERFGIGDDEDISQLSSLDFAPEETIRKMPLEEHKLLTEGRCVGEIDFQNRQGDIFPVLEVAIFHKGVDDASSYFSLTLLDISEQKKAEKELQRLNNELRQLSMHLQNIAEQERSAIAKEIHDEFAQNLTALRLNAAWLKNNIKDDNLKVKNTVDELISIADDAVQTSREIYNSLHPNMLDELGLEAAIRWNSAKIFQSTSIKLNIQTNIEDEKFPKEISLALFRIYQESMTNILRHSKATHVSIDIILKGKFITMTIQDNGVGFEMNDVDVIQSHGLLGIRERVYAFSGKLSIDSNHGLGTKLEVILPLQNEL